MNTITGKQYEMLELKFRGKEPEGSFVEIDLCARFKSPGTEISVKGFYAGEGNYVIRFLPEETGEYSYSVQSSSLGLSENGILRVNPADPGRHGPVRADGKVMRHADGTWFASFGTTVYALANQSEALIEETLETLKSAPFNKIRTCVFPKHYAYNENNPRFYPFEKKEGREEQAFSAEGCPIFPSKKGKEDDYWNTERPCFAFFEHLESVIRKLDDLGIQADLILFHPYDRWGFSNLSREDNLRYLDYLIRRLSAFPNIWWSLANEYDLCFDKTNEDFEAFEAFAAEADPFHHPLSNHNCFAIWDASHENISHVSFQTKELFRVSELLERYGKPVFIDECRYEGNVPEFWGNLSGEDMVRSFWKVMTQGGCCTHGETFLPGTKTPPETETGEKDVVFWAKGGKLRGQSPERIAFLKSVIESLPGPLEPMEDLSSLAHLPDEALSEIIRNTPPEFRDFLSRMAMMNRQERELFYSVEYSYKGHCGELAYLFYLDDQCPAVYDLDLPENRNYDIEVIDTWQMKRETAAKNVGGKVRIRMAGKPYMAVLAFAHK